MNLGTHMPGGERRKPIDIEDRRTKVKVTTSKNRTKIWYFFRFRMISWGQNVGSKWNLEHMCLMQWSGKRKWLWAIAAPSSQHSMGHFSVVFAKTKIFYGPFNFYMGHLHKITKLYVSNSPLPLPFPITADGERRKPIDNEVCRSQLLKIEQKIDTFFVSARYLKNKM